MKNLRVFFVLLEIYIVKGSYLTSTKTSSEQSNKTRTTEIVKENIQNFTSLYDWRTNQLKIYWNKTIDVNSSLLLHKLALSDSGKNICLNLGCNFTRIEKNDENTIFQINLNLTNPKNNLDINITEAFKNGTKKHYFGNLFVAMSEPSPVKMINLSSSGRDFLHVKWTDINKENPNTLVDRYLVLFNTSKVPEYVYKPEINVSKLSECTIYCFTITATNKANLSSNVSSECFSTKTRDLQPVHLFNISSEYNSTREIRWNYTNPNLCIHLNLSYWIKDDPGKIFNKTINSSKSPFQMTNLEYNKLYRVQITPKTENETENGEKIGKKSNIVEFFTGIKNITIKYPKFSMAWHLGKLRLQWDFDEIYRGNILRYSVLINNASKCVMKIVYEFISDPKVPSNTNNCLNTSIIPRQFNKTNKMDINIPNNIISFSVDIYGANALGEQNLTSSWISFTLKAPASKINLTLKEKGLHYFIFNWNHPERNDTESPIMGYKITKLNTSTTSIENGTETRIEILQECTKYCFTIEAFNGAGSSPPSDPQCYTTKTKNLASVTLDKISSERKTSKLIRWNYSGETKCPVYYNLVYWNSKGSTHRINIKINGTSHNLTDLELNEKYSIQIEPCTLLDTENGRRCGESSKPVQFFTIPETVQLSKLNYSMDWHQSKLFISWAVDKDSENSLLYYIIQFSNSTNNCTKAAIYQFNSRSVDSSNKHLDFFKFCTLNDTKNASVTSIFSSEINCCEGKINFNITLFALNKIGLSKLTNCSIKISMEKPDSISDVYLEERSLHNLTLRWDQPGFGNNNNKPIKEYQLKWKDQRKLINSTSTTIDELDICTEYCFTIVASNKAGSSGSSPEKCFTTQAPSLSKPTLNNISSGYLSSRSVSWHYPGSRNCSVAFHLEYGIINSKYKNYSLINNGTFCTIRELQMNELYFVRVKPRTTFNTPDGLLEGPSSEIVIFYTGIDQISLQDFQIRHDRYEEKFLFSWKINKTLNQHIQGYMILVKNSTKACLSILELVQREFDRIRDTNYTDQKRKLFKKHKCPEPLTKCSIFDESLDLKFDLKVHPSISDYIVEVFVFNKLGFQVVEQKEGKIRNPNKNLLILILILLLLMAGFVIFAVVFYRDKMAVHLPFLNSFNTSSASMVGNVIREPLFQHMLHPKVIPIFNAKRIKTKKSNGETQMISSTNEEKQSPILDERFFDCITLKEFLDKIVGFEKSLDEFSGYVEFMKENTNLGLIQEYAKLNNLTATLEHQLHLTKFLGKSPFNIKKNRFCNILPFDQNLVFLKSKSAPENYLNASYVPFSEDTKKIEYIASQGPIESTISDFFLMIWEQNVSCIVMLTRTYEDEKFKCLQYWPNDLREICQFGHQKEFLLGKLYEKEESSYFERKFSLKNAKTHEERYIYQIHMHMWMDFSAPDLLHFQSVLVRFQDMMETMINPPFLVHCSAGVGRTGTFICLDRIVRRLNKGLQHIDVFTAVMELRASRNFMVQRNSQYIFIHEFLKFYIKNFFKNGNIQMISTV